jgi:TnpA family transposase
MTAIDRTAYPRPGERLTLEELSSRYGLVGADHTFIRAKARGDTGRLMLATLLKTRQDLGGFPALSNIHAETIAHLAFQLALVPAPGLLDEPQRQATLHHHRAVVRAYLGVAPYGEAGESLVVTTVTHAAETMSDPADLINRAIEALGKAAIDLPAFSTLDRLANHVRAQVHAQMFDTVAVRLTVDHEAMLNALLMVPEDSVTTGFNRLKQTPGPARPKNIRLWTDRLNWLKGLIGLDSALEGITHTKVRQFAAEASALEVRDLLDISKAGKRYTLLLSLIRQARARCRDELIEMLVRRVRRTQAMAKEKLKALHDRHREMEETLIAIFGRVLDTAKIGETDEVAGSRIRVILAEQGGIDALSERCETVGAWHHNNDLPLLWGVHANSRGLMFQLLELMEIRSATQEQSLLEALALVVANRQSHRDELVGELKLGFASARWHNFVIKRRDSKGAFDRRALEVCVFIHLADALQTGDVYVVGAECFDDYRKQLLPWTECQKRLTEYCRALGLPETGQAFAAQLKQRLAASAIEVDAGFPKNSELTFDTGGFPHLKKQHARAQPAGLAAFEQEIAERMKERHLLDIIRDGAFWTRFTRHFGPPSGANPKLSNALQRYLFTVFGYGCNLGPSQTARHAPDLVTAETLRQINAQHIDTAGLEAATTDVVDQYARFTLPKVWGQGHAAIADGTHAKLRENNLLGSQHIRYGAYGGIAYHHIADSYIALFTSFIPCGVWEAVHILDGLIRNRSKIQPDTLHADTQGQSEPVFGLASMIGIKLMPRMRNWDDVNFYRPDKSARYQHIDALFSHEIDWDLIATHWQDMMQVVLSIQAGLVLPSMLLRKLGSHNRKNRLCLAFREVGRVERTLFLLRYISDPEIRRTIHAETTKIESFNDFLDWITFGGPVIKSGDPVEEEKQLKYATLIANTIMLSNVADLTEVLSAMAADGHLVTPALAACLSPYLRKQIRRFGRFSLDMADQPDPLNPVPLPFNWPLE